MIRSLSAAVAALVLGYVFPLPHGSAVDGLTLDAGVPVHDLKSTNHQVELKQTGKSTATCRIAAGDYLPMYAK